MELAARTPREFVANDVGENALPSLREPWMRALIVLTLALQAFAWWRVEGYQIADSVEFMEIAQSLVRGEERVDAGLIRPFGFSFVLLPFFAIADWIGIRDLRSIVWCVTLVEILLGCVLVVLTARIAARIGGRTCAIAAALLVATNPIFLQYSTQPESGIPAGVCIALALERLLVARKDRPITARDALVGGLWLGAAFLVAYKTLLVSLVLLVLVFLRDRWKNRRTWILAGTGLMSALVLQSVLDWLMFGAFGGSVLNYLAQNTGSVTTSVLVKLHVWIGGGVHGVPLQDQPRSWFLDRAEEIYRIRAEVTGEVYTGPTQIGVYGKMSPWFYFTELPSMLPWPAIALLVVGAAATVVRRNVSALILLALFAVNIAAMSNKGQKEFRLWLPLLPILVPIVALGFAEIADTLLARRAPARRFVTGSLFAAIGVLSLIALSKIEMKRFGGYWAAMDWVNRRAAETLPQRAREAERLGLAEPERLRVAGAYHWAVFHRSSALVELVKLPWQLNMWKRYPVDASSGLVTQHSDDLSALEEVDVFIVHLPVLSEHPELMRWVSSNFDVSQVFYDQQTYGDLGPIFALERRSADPHARRFLEEHHGVDPVEFQERRQLRGAFDFIDPDDPTGERLQLLGVEYQPVPPMGFGWITYHWRAPKKPSRDWTLVDRMTAPSERYVWDNGHHGAYGALPTDAWEPGVIVSEGYLVVPAAEPYRAGAPFRPIGGAYLRGDLIPVRCWVGVVAFGPIAGDGTPPEIVDRLVAARPGSLEPARPVDAVDLFETADGTQFSADGLVRVRGLLLPVLEKARVPDDGRMIRE